MGMRRAGFDLGTVFGSFDGYAGNKKPLFQEHRYLHQNTDKNNTTNIKHAYPRTHTQRLLKLAAPLFVESAANIGTQLVATTVVSRRGGGARALSALALAQTQLSVGVSVVCGLAAAMETFCGQAFGARQFRLLGRVLQCALALCMCVAAPAAALWALGGVAPALRALGQAPRASEEAGILLARMWPVLPLLAVSETTGQCEREAEGDGGG